MSEMHVGTLLNADSLCKLCLFIMVDLCFALFQIGSILFMFVNKSYQGKISIHKSSFLNEQ